MSNTTTVRAKSKPKTVSEIALARGLAFLEAAGVKFAVELKDGSIVGALKVAVQHAAKKSRNNFDAEFSYISDLDALAPGESLTWKLGKRAAKFRNALDNAVRKRYGVESCIISRVGGTVKILRVL